MSEKSSPYNKIHGSYFCVPWAGADLEILKREGTLCPRDSEKGGHSMSATMLGRQRTSSVSDGLKRPK